MLLSILFSIPFTLAQILIGVCMCVFIYLYRCGGFLSLCACRGQVSGVFLNYFPTSCFETRASHCTWSSLLARVPTQQGPGILPSLSPLGATITTMCWHTWIFMWVYGIQTLATIMLVQKALCNRAISPAPFVYFIYNLEILCLWHSS